MPELPEVESLRRSLIPFIVGNTIQSVSVTEPKIVSSKGTKRSALVEKKNQFEEGLRGEKILSIERRAKNLIFILSHQKRILIHLKMTGQLVYKSSAQIVSGGHPIRVDEKKLPGSHTRIQFNLSDGTLFYNDIRMFGYVLYFSSEKDFLQENHFDKLGFEPDDLRFTLEEFSRGLRKRSASLKSVLMDQKLVVGLGNIYCDEVCFYAGVRPDRVCSSLKKHEVEKLYTGIHIILERAIALGGSSIADYLLADGSRGNYAREHKVYGKSGKRCLICENLLKKVIVHGRTTIYCPYCQQ